MIIFMWKLTELFIEEGKHKHINKVSYLTQGVFRKIPRLHRFNSTGLYILTLCMLEKVEQVGQNW